MAAAASSSDPIKLPSHTSNQQEDCDVAVDVDHHEFGDSTRTLLEHSTTSDRRTKVSRVVVDIMALIDLVRCRYSGRVSGPSQSPAWLI